MTTLLTAIGSGKGGTGKTLIAVSLAHALAHRGEKILLCDADLGLSNAAVHLGLAQSGDLAAVLSGQKTIKDAVATVVCGPRATFDILAAPAGSGAMVDAPEDKIAHLIHLLAHESAYDRVLIDLGAGVDAKVMQIAAHADEVLLVVSPDPASLTDAYAFAKLLLRRTQTRLPEIVVNMAMNVTEGRRVAEALTNSARAFLKFAPEFLGQVPLDSRVSEAVRRQTPLLGHFPQAPASVAIDAIALRLAGRRETPHAAAGLR